ncbi:hypothetical protein ZEAMMB73_Zm00001d035490 [Zea mays]|jgi:hypothetical protein
MFRR